jgi:kynurenine formamidase
VKNSPRIIDLTHTLSKETPAWDEGCCFELHTIFDYKDATGPEKFRVQKMNANVGIGTHIDAPAHCFPDGKTIEAIELQSLITECVVVHIQENVDASYVAMPDVVKVFEKEHGKIAPNAFVIFHTGWEKYWNDPKKYRNNLQFPDIHEDTAKMLLERNIAGIGIDTLSPDAGGKDFPVHRLILGAGKYLVENIANAGKVPPTGANISIMPMNIKGATEAPVRMIAVLS